MPRPDSRTRVEKRAVSENHGPAARPHSDAGGSGRSTASPSGCAVSAAAQGWCVNRRGPVWARSVHNAVARAGRGLRRRSGGWGRRRHRCSSRTAARRGRRRRRDLGCRRCRPRTGPGNRCRGLRQCRRGGRWCRRQGHRLSGLRLHSDRLHRKRFGGQATHCRAHEVFPDGGGDAGTEHGPIVGTGDVDVGTVPLTTLPGSPTHTAVLRWAV